MMMMCTTTSGTMDRSPIYRVIEDNLSHHMYENAIFLAERLDAQVGNDETIHLLATCYLRAGQPKRGISVLIKRHGECWGGSSSSCDSPSKQVRSKNRYLLARCCFAVGKLQEAENTLLGGTGIRKGAHFSIDLNLRGHDVPGGAYGLYILGLICKSTSRREEAVAYLSHSLKLDPFMWKSFRVLCELGHRISPDHYFDTTRAHRVVAVLQQAAPTMMATTTTTGRGAVCGASVPAASASVGIPRKATATATTTDRFQKPTRLFVTPRNDIDDDIGLVHPHHPSSTPAPADTKCAKDAFVTPAPPPSSSVHANTAGSSVATVAIESDVAAFFETPQMRDGSSGTSEATPMDVVETTPVPSSDLRYECGNDGGARARAAPQLRRKRKGPVKVWSVESSSASSMETPATSRVTPVNGGRLFMSTGPRGVASGTPSTTTKTPRTYATRSRAGGVAASVGIAGKRTSSRLRRKLRSDSVSSIPGVPPLYDRQHRPAFTGESKLSLEFSVAAELDVDTAVELIRRMGKAYQLLCMYRCKEAAAYLRSLPSNHRRTGWVQHQLGRAAFERADFTEAREHFAFMRKLEPHRMSGMELFSITLWHLKREVELAFLAQEVLAFDRRSPEAWCVVGNCFSLQKEHDAAMKFFERAVQLRPDFTYGHTLSGHEYVTNEDFDKAVTCFRHALRTDDRHYQAWYALGTVYYRQEKYDLAEYHFKRAIKINPCSSVLYCYLGMVLHAKKKLREALRVLDSASKLDPVNPQPNFLRAKVLRSLGRNEDALEELKAVRERAPREAGVYMLMGQLSEKLRDKDGAMRYYVTALGLKPQDSNMIKAAIDRLHSPDDEADGSGPGGSGAFRV